MKLMEKIAEYFSEDPKVIAVYIFGSHAKKKAHPNSDVDIAVLFKKINRKDAFNLSLKYSCDLMKCLSVNRVDVVILNTANNIIKNQIFKYGQIILDRDPAFTKKFKNYSILEYLDFLHTRREAEKRMKERIFKEAAHG